MYLNCSEYDQVDIVSGQRGSMSSANADDIDVEEGKKNI